MLGALRRISLTMKEKMKVLNLYAGIGGNRKLWTDVEVTAVELNPQIAKIYQDFFPQDKVIVADAHQYLLEHFKEFEFIWSSPLCQTHSRMNNLNYIKTEQGQEPKYPDMRLYQEVILLKHWAKGKWCIENVIGYYKPLLAPTESCSHYFWTNFYFTPWKKQKRYIREHLCDMEDILPEEYKNLKIPNKEQIINNMVNSELGLHILNESKRNVQPELFSIK
jgi:DNA (cytosine-5)-methyltransferase 1